jgi:hypothetical protein
MNFLHFIFSSLVYKQMKDKNGLLLSFSKNKIKKDGQICYQKLKWS